MTPQHTEQQGFDAFLNDVNQCVEKANKQRHTTRDFVLHIAERYAHIRPQDLKSPKRFYQQISSSPPVCFGTQGFRQSIVDDQEPARHYTAFVFVGYWLPTLLAVPFLWAWEVLGFVRYGHWSQPDVRSGLIGIRHGRAIRREGASVLPVLICRDLGETEVRSKE